MQPLKKGKHVNAPNRIIRMEYLPGLGIWFLSPCRPLRGRKSIKHSRISHCILHLEILTTHLLINSFKTKPTAKPSQNLLQNSFDTSISVFPQSPNFRCRPSSSKNNRKP
jgi:hypothetical protein